MIGSKDTLLYQAIPLGNNSLLSNLEGKAFFTDEFAGVLTKNSKE
jgi:hypothetical protein